MVCAYSSPTTARFVFKDCWDEAAMNDEATNKGGYHYADYSIGFAPGFDI